MVICMNEKPNIDDIRSLFKKEGYRLLSSKYINSRLKLAYECPEGHENQMLLSNFRRGARCPDCAGKKITIEQVRLYLEKKGYRLLSTEYLNCKSKLNYECPKGHKDQMSWEKFRAGCRCPRCCGHKRHTIEQVKLAFEKEGYHLLSQEYINIRTSLAYKCSSGHENQMSYTNFQQGYRCPDCAGNKVLTIEQVRLAFEKEGYQLLSNKYINCTSKLDYRCSKHHENQTDWLHFQRGHRCPECWEWKNEKKLGEILKKIFPNRVKRQNNLGFLNKQKVDYSISDSQLAFEYDGECHFKPVQYGGMDIVQAERCFVDQQQRDSRKNRLCKENGYHLVRISYKESLTLENVKTKIDEALGAK